MGATVSVGVFVLAGVFVFVTAFVDVGVNVAISVDASIVEVAIAGTTLITTVSNVPKYCPCAFCIFQLPV